MTSLTAEYNRRVGQSDADREYIDTLITSKTQSEMHKSMTPKLDSGDPGILYVKRKAFESVDEYITFSTALSTFISQSSKWHGSYTRSQAEGILIPEYNIHIPAHSNLYDVIPREVKAGLRQNAGAYDAIKFVYHLIWLDGPKRDIIEYIDVLLSIYRQTGGDGYYTLQVSIVFKCSDRHVCSSRTITVRTNRPRMVKFIRDRLPIILGESDRRI